MSTIDTATIARLEALLAEATPGPWRWYLGALMNETDSAGQGYPLDIYPDSVDVVSAHDDSGDDLVPIRVRDEDAALIAESRNALPALLTAARAWLSLVELARRQPGVAVEDAVEAVAGGK